MADNCDFKVGDTIYLTFNYYDELEQKSIRILNENIMYIITSIGVSGGPSITSNCCDFDIVYVATIRDVRTIGKEETVFIQSNFADGTKEVYAVKTA